VIDDGAGDVGGAVAGADDEDRAVVEALRAHPAGDDPQHDLLGQQQQQREHAEEDEPGSRELPEGEKEGQRGQEHDAHAHHADGREGLARQRNRAVGVVAVVGEEQDRPDDEDDRVDLQVLLQRKEAGREMGGIEGREQEIADEEGRKKRDRRQDEVDAPDDPRNQSCLLLQHPVRSFTALLYALRKRSV